MDTSVLYYVKGFLGIDLANCAFDAQILSYINMAINTLRQVGVGEGVDGLVPNITGIEETWLDIIGPDEVFLEMVKTFVALTVRLYFDPPTNSFLVSSIKDRIDELTWRIEIEVEERRRANG